MPDPAATPATARAADPPPPGVLVAPPGVATKKADPQALIYPAALLAGALIVAALLIYVTDRWRKNRERQADESGNLTSFRAMYESGEITEAEYKALRDKVAAKLKSELPGGLPRVTPKPPPEKPSEGPPGDPT